MKLITATILLALCLLVRCDVGMDLEMMLQEHGNCWRSVAIELYQRLQNCEVEARHSLEMNGHAPHDHHHHDPAYHDHYDYDHHHQHGHPEPDTFYDDDHNRGSGPDTTKNTDAAMTEPSDQTTKAYPGVTDAPTDVPGAPTDVTDDPTDVTDDPTDVSDAPTGVSDAPTDVSDAPTGVSDAPIDVTDDPGVTDYDYYDYYDFY